MGEVIADARKIEKGYEVAREDTAFDERMEIREITAREDTERPDAEALKNIIRNDKTPPYIYASARGNVGQAAMNAKGEWPPAGQRWQTPREIAEGALRDTEREPEAMMRVWKATGADA